MTSAKIIADSISPSGKRITTFELEYARWIHGEFMTHRMISKNAASSRAIPIEKMIQTILDNTAFPVSWGKNQAGMQAEKELDLSVIDACKYQWLEARDNAIETARKLSSLGLHKQITNRVLEPFSHIKVVATATEWDNFFYLRCHKDAQPEFQALAKAMYKEYSTNTSRQLEYGEWHLPYVSKDDLKEFGIKDCKILSASLCAQVSYRKSDDSIEKARTIFDKLINSKPSHSSPTEHQATPSALGDERSSLTGNFYGWLQHRKEIVGETCYKYISKDS